MLIGLGKLIGRWQGCLTGQLEGGSLYDNLCDKGGGTLSDFPTRGVCRAGQGEGTKRPLMRGYAWLSDVAGDGIWEGQD